jgi:hypothetical protein
MWLICFAFLILYNLTTGNIFAILGWSTSAVWSFIALVKTMEANECQNDIRNLYKRLEKK